MQQVKLIKAIVLRHRLLDQNGLEAAKSLVFEKLGAIKARCGMPETMRFGLRESTVTFTQQKPL